ncbi:hypothetical protein L195_g054699, partial [Trifolium pratense]
DSTSASDFGFRFQISNFSFRFQLQVSEIQIVSIPSPDSNVSISSPDSNVIEFLALTPTLKLTMHQQEALVVFEALSSDTMLKFREKHNNG